MAFLILMDRIGDLPMKAASMKYVLIGAGPAGVRAAEALRQQDPSGDVTLISGEPGEPYARMAIPLVQC